MREVNSHPKKKNWQSGSTWMRGVFMILFGFIAGFTRFLITLIAIFQFLCLLISGKPNPTLKRFGFNLNNYIYQINQFLTLNSKRYPFPLSGWPEEKPHYGYAPRN